MILGLDQDRGRWNLCLGACGGLSSPAQVSKVVTESCYSSAGMCIQGLFLCVKNVTLNTANFKCKYSSGKEKSKSIGAKIVVFLKVLLLYVHPFTWGS